MQTNFFAALIFSAFLMHLDASAQTSFQRNAQPTQQVRPFITDDARVVGNRLTQLESWYRQDKGGIEQWILTAYGPTP